MKPRLIISEPNRSHKSKKTQLKKPTTRIIGGGFVERNRKPETQGKNTRSRLIRVDVRFADHLREKAKSSGLSITEITRLMLLV